MDDFVAEGFVQIVDLKGDFVRHLGSRRQYFGNTVRMKNFVRKKSLIMMKMLLMTTTRSSCCRRLRFRPRCSGRSSRR